VSEKPRPEPASDEPALDQSIDAIRPDPYVSLKIPELRYLMVSRAFATFAGRSLAVVIGYQIYQLTKDPLALGILGLVEVIPALSLALFGGHIADRNDRRAIILVTDAVSILCALLFAFLSRPEGTSLWGLYGVVFIAGIARGFADPAFSAFEGQVIPRELMVNASSWLSSVGQACAIIGPALGGFAYAYLGARGTYLLIALFFTLAWTSIFLIRRKPVPPATQGEPILRSISLGVKYVFQNQVIVGSMALDLFAVLFGGAIALLPVFASDILKVGPQGLGFLLAAPSVGALLVMLWSTRHPPTKRAGSTLLLAVAGFGISIIVFALSKNFFLSLVALAFTGVFDGISMVIRGAILRLRSPEHLRGRIASVSWMFIGSSNEIGALESGVAARLLGTIPTVWIGGVVTLLVVAVTAYFAPELRRLDLGTQVDLD
jgi:MFS family permease